MTLEAVLAKLDARRNGSGWKALCPAHADRNPSLSINVHNGKVLLHCHSGCSQEMVLAALGIKPGELTLDDSNSKARIVAEYPYTDENGGLLYQVLRFHPKGFRQRRPDSNGGWVWNLNGTRRVLYRLPQVLAATEIFVVEGEKDVAAAERFGVVATTNPGGAGKWCEEYSESLRGKRIAVIADADEPGRKHAQQVAASLSGKAESVKVLELPHAKDLSEWKAADGTRDALLELIRNAPEWKPAEPTAESPIPQAEQQPAKVGTGIDPSTFRELFDSYEELCNAPPLSFAIRDFLQHDGITMIGGLPGHGKTLMMLSMAKALLTGNPLWNHFPVEERAVRVVYLIPECARGPFAHRLKLFGLLPFTAPDDERLLVRTLSKGRAPDLDDPRLQFAAKGAHVFLDTAIRFADAKDENSSAENQLLAEDLFALLAAGARSVTGAHHSPKAFARDSAMSLENVLRGTGDLGAILATCFGIKQIDKDTNTVHVENVKPRDFTPPLPFQLIGRPNIDEKGDFLMLKKPGECGSLADEQPELNQANSSKHETRTAQIALVKGWLDHDPNLTSPELREKFAKEGIKLTDSAIRRYRQELKKEVYA